MLKTFISVEFHASSASQAVGAPSPIKKCQNCQKCQKLTTPKLVTPKLTTSKLYVFTDGPFGADFEIQMPLRALGADLACVTFVYDTALTKSLVLDENWSDILTHTAALSGEKPTKAAAPAAA